MKLYQLIVSLFIFSHIICPAAAVATYRYDEAKPYASGEAQEQAWTVFKGIAADYPEFCETYNPSHLNGIITLKNSVRTGKEGMTRDALISRTFKPDQTVLLYAEKGLGDTIMWVRYIEAFCAKFPTLKVTVNVQGPLLCLKDMLKCSEEITFEKGLKPDDSAFDYCLSLFELPSLLNAPLPTGEAYLTLSDDVVAAAQADLEFHARGRLKVGICFRGAKEHKYNEARSVPLDVFKPLFERTDICVFSLQVGDGQDAVASIPSIVDLSPKLKAISDTAAYVKALDIVITIDSMMGHLAGALGVQTIELVCPHPDFRWAIGLHDSAPWYKSQKLFRQGIGESWDVVMARVIKEDVDPAVAARS